MQDLAPFETIAQIAIAIAGFAGVIIAVADASDGRPAPAKRPPLRNLLHASLGAALFALIPQVCFAATGSEVASWRLAHGPFGAYHVAVWATFARRIPEHALQPSERRVFVVSTLAGGSIVVAHAVVALGWALASAFAIYFAALLWSLVVAT